MDSDEYLQRITELVYDDNEIVTCSVLSRNLKINVRDAQHLLDKYVENADVPEQNDLSWTFTVIGTDEDGGFVILVADQDELNKRKEQLKSIISQHAYSIHRKGNIDKVAIANLEPFIEHKIRHEPLQGCVVSKNAIKRKLKAKVVIENEIKQENKIQSKQNSQSHENNSKRNGIEGFCVKGSTPNIISKPATNSKTQQKNMIASFISKSRLKDKDSNNHMDKVQNNNPKTNENEKTNNTADKNVLDKENIEIDDDEPVVVEEVTKSHAKGSSRTKEDTEHQSKKSKKRKSQNKTNQTAKRRKRIVETAGSDSDIFASSESEIEIEPDIHLSDDNPEEVDTVIPSKPRRMKQITEEFMDEDGYMNTVQKYIMVSDDEDESTEKKVLNAIAAQSANEKPIVKVKETKAPLTKKETMAKNGKGKGTKTVQNQPSIMNFFKKA